MLIFVYILGPSIVWFFC